MLKTYRLYAFERGGYEVLTDQIHLIALDLDTPLGISLARVELENARVTLARALNLDGSATAFFRLEVHEHDDRGALVMDWCGA